MASAPRLSRAELALLDRLATEEYGLPVAVLMENAGRGAADLALAMLDARKDRARSVAVLAGPGNNGGDACVLARHLANAGVGVVVLATSAPAELDGAAASMRTAVERMGIEVLDASTERDLERARPALESAAVIVDGLLGTGFRGEMRPKIARIVEAANACRESRERNAARILALDLPSGLDADSGRPANPAIRADVTATFAAWKTGFDAPEARAHLGRVELVGIGAPAELVESILRARG